MVPFISGFNGCLHQRKYIIFIMLRVHSFVHSMALWEIQRCLSQFVFIFDFHIKICIFLIQIRQISWYSTNQLLSSNSFQSNLRFGFFSFGQIYCTGVWFYRRPTCYNSHQISNIFEITFDAVNKSQFNRNK